MLNIVEYWMFDDIGPLVHCLDLDSHSTCGIRLQLAEALESLVPQLVQKAGTTSTVCQTESPVRSWLHFTSVLQLGERLADPEAGAMFFRGWYPWIPWIPWIPWMEHSTNCNLRMPPVGLGLICACPIPRFQGFSKCILRVPLGFDPLSRFIPVP